MPSSTDRQQATAWPESTPVTVARLRLDRRNPRIQEAGASDLDQDALVGILWREYSVDEVAISLAQNGFFPQEPLFAADEDGELVVIEGNRRLAAIRLLLEEDLRNRLRADVPPISDDRASELSTVPVVICTREQVWQYIGFKHVNGPQAWDSFAKAEYIAWVTNDLHQDLTSIGRTIGDTHSTVARLYRAYMALKQAEEAGVYTKDARTRRHFSFSHLYTGLDYSGIGTFTAISPLTPPTDKPIPRRKLKAFGELCVWLWGDASRNREPVIRSQNPDLRKLDETLQSADGIAALRAGYSLTTALDIARGDTALFREALLKAKQSLQEARGKVVTGFNGEPDLVREMEQIVDLTSALEDDMAKRPRRRARLRRA